MTVLNEEIKIYQKDYNPDRVRGKHIAPHTLEVAAMWGCSHGWSSPSIMD
ncbi:MAG: hypothetical protein R3C02_19020 [Planctomycetaceae bacterium]